MHAIERERRDLIGLLRQLPEDAWATPSLCAGWSVREVLGHLVTPFLVSTPSMGLAVMRRGGIAGAMDAAARRLAQRDPAELLDVLEANAASRFRPPGLPASAPLTDIVVHSADIRWVLSDVRTDWGDPARLREVLGFVTGRRAAAGFVPPGRLRGVRFEATDLDWTHGSGQVVRGEALHLAVAVLGRGAARDLVSGDGVDVLFGRLAA